MARKLVDLTVTMTNGMPSHKFFPRPVIVPHLTHEDFMKMGNGVPGDPLSGATTYFGMIDHIGTHIDAFYHVKQDGLPIDRMPLDMFMGKAVCFDLRHIPDLGDIDVADLERAEQKAGVKVDGHIVLMCTGLHKRHYPNPEVCVSNPGLTAAATHWLHARGSRLHGVEGPSTDKPSDKLFAQHRTCRDLGITHMEWLVNLEALLGKGEFEFFGVPIKFKGGSGSPIRAFAILDA